MVFLTMRYANQFIFHILVSDCIPCPIDVAPSLSTIHFYFRSLLRHWAMNSFNSALRSVFEHCIYSCTSLCLRALYLFCNWLCLWALYLFLHFALSLSTVNSSAIRSVFEHCIYLCTENLHIQISNRQTSIAQKWHLKTA